jgi:L-aspartate oxidase
LSTTLPKRGFLTLPLHFVSFSDLIKRTCYPEEKKTMRFESDFLVIGGGIAGLWFAIRAAQHGTVTVLAKKDARESSTNYAQGGIAAVSSKEDSFEDHIQDTVIAGAGLCNQDVVRSVISEGPPRIEELVQLGVEFTTRRNAQMDEFDLGLEGGHSKRRILHAADFTGREIIDKLFRIASENPKIQFRDHHIAIDLLIHPRDRTIAPREKTCRGAYVLNSQENVVHTFVSPTTVLATGGAGKVYLYTSNPDVATGDGVAMAYRAGARIANMEFIQFHPTCLYHPKAKSFLISEAVRGEGGVLRVKDSTPFMDRYHPKGCLAPRDIVARAIDNELKKRGDEYVYLDITHRDPEFIRSRFPNIYQQCLSLGIDITREAMPVVPAAHYTCGGVIVDASGQTDIQNLYAVGEVACTGLHGANRLASNSLLEALVFAQRAYDASIRKMGGKGDQTPSIPDWTSGNAVDSDESIMVAHNWDEVRRLMSNYVGIFRSNKRLERAKRRIDALAGEIHQYYWDFLVTSDLIELRNLIQVADLIITSAMMRKESRGLHYNINYPVTDDTMWRRDTIQWRGYG